MLLFGLFVDRSLLNPEPTLALLGVKVHQVDTAACQPSPVALSMTLWNPYRITGSEDFHSSSQPALSMEKYYEIPTFCVERLSSSGREDLKEAKTSVFQLDNVPIYAS